MIHRMPPLPDYGRSQPPPVLHPTVNADPYGEPPCARAPRVDPEPDDIDPATCRQAEIEAAGL